MSPSEEANDVSAGASGVIENSSDESIVQSFVDAIPLKDRSLLDLELQSFVIRHASQHRPIALVSSGGTAADLEVNSVRCLDNFSTGKRGAISVEGENGRMYRNQKFIVARTLFHEKCSEKYPLGRITKT